MEKDYKNCFYYNYSSMGIENLKILMAKFRYTIICCYINDPEFSQAAEKSIVDLRNFFKSLKNHQKDILFLTASISKEDECFLQNPSMLESLFYSQWEEYPKLALYKNDGDNLVLYNAVSYSERLDYDKLKNIVNNIVNLCRFKIKEADMVFLPDSEIADKVNIMKEERDIFVKEFYGEI